MNPTFEQKIEALCNSLQQLVGQWQSKALITLEEQLLLQASIMCCQFDGGPESE